MARHDNDPAAASPGDGEPTGPETRADDAVPSTEQNGAEAPAIVVPTDGATSEAAPTAPPSRPKNRQIFTFLAASLGLLATAGAIGAYRLRDKHEKLASFATAVDEIFARPEQLISALREKAERLGEAKTSMPPEAAKKPEPVTKPDAAKPDAAATARNGDRITWSTPPAAPAPAVPVPAAPKPTAPTIAQAPAAPPPIAAPVAPVPDLGVAALKEETAALAKRVAELEQIASSALRLAEQASAAAARSGANPVSAPPRANDPRLQDVQDNVTGLEGRIDELGDEVQALRDKLAEAKDETRAPREVAPPEPPPKLVEEDKTASPAVAVVVAHSLQKALDRGAPYSSEITALAAHGADPAALAALAPDAEKGSPTPHALRSAFHPLVEKMRSATEPKAGAPLGDRLMQGVSKLVKVHPAGEPPKALVTDLGGKVEAALDHDDLEKALAAFAELPEDAKTVASEWAKAVERRLEAERAAASILSSAIAALAKSKS